MKTSRLLVGEMDFSTTYQVTIRSVAPSFPSPASRSFLPSMSRWDGFGSRLLMPRTTETALIYVVDDAECVSELYAHFLKGTGYTAKIFNDRAAALTALKEDRSKPDLLITDYLGDRGIL